jgi:cell division protein FtsW
MNSTLFLAQLVLIGMGWVGVATAAPESWPRHALFSIAAVIVTLIVSRAKPQAFVRFAPHIWTTTMIGLVALLIISRVTKSSIADARGLDLGLFSVQFSEFAKIALILYLANFFTRRGLGYKLYGPVMVIGLTSGLVVALPSFSAGVFVFMLGITVMFIAGIRLFRIISILLFAAMLAWPTVEILGRAFPHVAERFGGYYNTFVQGEIDCQNYGYQVCNTKRILENAGIIGLGPDVPMRPNFFATSTDFVIAPIAHATGLIGVAVVIAMFCMILYLGFRIAESVSGLAARNPDPERQTDLQVAAVMAASATLMIVAQAVVNLGVSIGNLPNTGMTLPMISYGGSSMMALGVAFGWVQAAHRETQSLENPRAETVLTGTD